ncbi:ABC transporter permease [Microlunatus speluncae]|uniref:ABC transporter permease n=1 Tax=Microlunatus speluncae TaxID=2594267 RepID=UPI001FE5178B|nr:ABC transporter permease subunit [Microlunatus speluncae]
MGQGVLSAEPTKAAADAVAEPVAVRRRRTLQRRLWQARWCYLFILPGLVYFVIFRYVPLLGNAVAWQDYSPFLGFEGSPWVAWDNFARLLTDPEVANALINTLWLSVLQIVFAFPAPLLLALLLNSILSDRIKRFVQSVVYLPHFIGWVIVVSIWQALFGGTGAISEVLSGLTGSSVNLMTNPDTFALLITSQVIWKEIGWGTIIFLAAMALVPLERYEAAAVDGAGGWRRIWHITLPGIAPVIVLLLILRLGSVLTVGFEQIILQQDAVGADVAQVLDTFVYYRGVLGGDWGLATAAGLVKGLVGTVLVLGANWLAKRLGGEGAF